MFQKGVLKLGEYALRISGFILYPRDQLLGCTQKNVPKSILKTSEVGLEPTSAKLHVPFIAMVLIRALSDHSDLLAYVFSS